MRDWTYGETIEGLTVDGREVHAPVFNENEVRAAAGITMALGAVAFVYANFEKVFVPIQARHDLLLHRLPHPRDRGDPVQPRRRGLPPADRRLEPQWVSAKPKRFAWTLGLDHVLRR